MEVQLIVKQKKKPNRIYRLRAPESVLGRAHGTAVRIPSDDVSREHCRIVIEGASVTVQDLGSLNGTLLNGVVVEGVQEIQPGDFLRVGPALFQVEFDPAKAAKEPDFEIVEEDEVAGHDEEYIFEVVEDSSDRDVPVVGSGGVPPNDLEFDQSWQVPESGNLRDLLAQLDDRSDSTPPKPKKPKKKN